MKQVFGLQIHKFALGGADIQVRACGFNNQLANEDNILAAVKRVLSYFPDNVLHRLTIVRE